MPIKKDKSILKEGTIGDLKYKIFDRGNIQISEGDKIFRKELTILERVLSETNYETMKEGDSIKIDGAGDTDPLFIYKEKGVIGLRLRKNLPVIINELLSIIDSV
jgi:hypothetical protein